MEIGEIYLVRKSGGKSGLINNGYKKERKEGESKVEKKEQRWKAAVVTLSDKGYAGEREDKSGPLLCGMLEEAGYEVTEVRLLPDEQKMIEQCLCELADEKKVNLIATTGGTGFAPRDCTPEATFAVATKNATGNRRGDETGFTSSDTKSYA